MPQMTDGSYNTRMEKWTAREMQLNRLHEEIVSRRESLLRSAGNYLRLHREGHQQSSARTEDLAARNEQLLQDVWESERRLAEESEAPPSTRFHTLQANYWSMIRGMAPLWEKSVENALVAEKVGHMTTPRTPRS